jgi:hypothetical protein
MDSSMPDRLATPSASPVVRMVMVVFLAVNEPDARLAPARRAA